MTDDPEFEDKPIPLISEKFELENDGVEFLQKLSTKNVSVLTIIGAASSGKSFLASHLVGKYSSGFTIGSVENEEEGCTKGLWIWGRPIIKDDYYILILDAQGLKIDTEENLLISQKIFALSTFISSVVIFNYKKTDFSDDNTKISEEVLNQSFEMFNKLLPFFNNIKLEDNGDIEEELNKVTAKHIPKFFYLYRDYNVKNINKEKIYQDFLNNFLEKNKDFKELFGQKISLCCLPCPMEEHQMMVNAYLDEEDEDNKKPDGPFNNEYKTAFNNLKAEILNTCLPKSIKGLTFNGNLFYALLQEYASTIDSGENIFIESSLSAVFFSNLGEITERIIDSKRENLEEKNNEECDIIEKFKNAFTILSEDGAYNEYGTEFIGKLLHSEFISDGISRIVSSLADEVVDNQIGENLTQYNEDLKKLTEDQLKEKTQTISKPEDIKGILVNLSVNIKKDIEEKIFPKDKEFISSFPFIKDYISKCICDKIKSIADSINFFIEHNLQTIESSSKSNIGKLEEKIEEINKKDNIITDMRAKLEFAMRQSQKKEEELKNQVEQEKEKYNNLEKNNQLLIEEKDKLIKDLEARFDKLNKESKSTFEEINLKNSEFIKISNKVNLENKDKEIHDLKNKIKELENKNPEKKGKKEESKQKNNIALKSEDMPKLKEMFKMINNTYKNYLETVHKLENNKELVFREKFIEESNSYLQKKNKNWVEELNSFNEEHYKKMTENYLKKVKLLKEENNNLREELKQKNKEIEDKNRKYYEIKISRDRTNDILSHKDQTIAACDELLKQQKEITQKKINDLKDKENYVFNIEKQLVDFKLLCNDKSEDIETLNEIFYFYETKDNSKLEECVKKLTAETREFWKNCLASINDRKKK